MRRLRKLRRFLALPVSEQFLTIEAAGWLAIANLSVKLFPMRWIAPHLGADSDSNDACSGGDLWPLHRATLRRAIQNTPWSGSCLVQAIGGKLFLQRQGTQSTLHIGVAKTSADTAISAHAWLSVGIVPVVGGVATEYERLCSFV